MSDKKQSQAKYIFVLGGVISSIGKGITSASLGSLIEGRGIKINIIKCDPYLNVDPGTMSPHQHGEVYVTEDGGETDLDLGHYERFTHISLNKGNSITFGQVLETILQKERGGGFEGKTVQFIPHITDEIKNCIYKMEKKTSEVVIVEIGGTVGDMESQSFCEAIRQMRNELGPDRSAIVYVTYVPYIPSARELKTKPTQTAVRKLQELGLDLDFLLCRSDHYIPDGIRKKISENCNVDLNHIISAEDSHFLHQVPLKLHKEKLDQLILKKLKVKPKRDASVEKWKKAVATLESSRREVKVAMVGKYHYLRDSYKSLHQALIESSIGLKVRLNVIDIDSDDIKSLARAKDLLSGCDAIVIPGGFGTRGLLGKVIMAEYARISQTPFLGICFGMQAAVISFARYVCKIKGATSREVSKSKADTILFDYIDEKKSKVLGGSMRLGSQSIQLTEGSQIQSIYKKKLIKERHRHRYVLSKKHQARLSKKGLVFSGVSQGYAEIIENPDHPWFIGVQYHPEFKSRMNRPHLLFSSLLKTALELKKKSR